MTASPLLLALRRASAALDAGDAETAREASDLAARLLAEARARGTPPVAAELPLLRSLVEAGTAAARREHGRLLGEMQGAGSARRARSAYGR